MSPANHLWEQIYQKEGRREEKPFLRFYEVVSSFKKYDCKEILDLGCGRGRHLIHLAREGFHVVGMDFSPTGLRLTREWVESEKIDAFVVMADMRIPFPLKGSSFDGLLSTQVIHHARLATIKRTIGEIFRILKPGGIAFITVSARMNDLEFIEIEPNTYIPQEGPEKGLPHHIFSEDDLRRQFQKFLILEVSLRAEGKVRAILVQKRKKND